MGTGNLSADVVAGGVGKGLKSEEQQMQRAIGENVPGCLRNCKETSIVEQSEGETRLFVSLLRPPYCTTPYT